MQKTKINNIPEINSIKKIFLCGKLRCRIATKKIENHLYVGNFVYICIFK